MTALQPCRFCGETTRLHISERAFLELSWGLDEHGCVLRDETGQPFADCAPENGMQDGVSCEVCEALVPLRVWNATPDWLVRMRSNILAADAEFDDDGAWQGPAQAVAA